MRIKTGFIRSRKHHKVLKRTRGFRMTKNRLFKVAQEADRHADQYSYGGRKIKKRDLRSLWILRINAALKENNISYSQFINMLKKSKIAINRKMLSELAISDPKAFMHIVKSCQSSS